MRKYYEGYAEAREKIQNQTLKEDLDLIDGLFGRDNLAYGATPEEVKREALRQSERDFTNPEWQKTNQWAFDLVTAMGAK